MIRRENKMGKTDDFWNTIGSIAVGIIGGKIALSMLEESCESCGHISSKLEDICPKCLQKKFRSSLR